MYMFLPSKFQKFDILVPLSILFLTFYFLNSKYESKKKNKTLYHFLVSDL